MTERTPPRVEGAPGLVWRERKKGWVAYWQARSDLVKRGYAPGAKKLWEGAELDEIDRLEIATQCNELQSTMLIWGRDIDSGQQKAPLITMSSLVQKYLTDEDSSFLKKRWAVRKKQTQLLNRIEKRFGEVMISDIKGRTLLAWHKEWSDDGKKPAAGQTFISVLRTMIRFGASILEDQECVRLRMILSDQKYKGVKPREEHLTADMAIAVRKAAHDRGWCYMALAQAIQFECTLRQKDVIGEWIPVTEPGVSDVIRTIKYNKKKRVEKWMVGIRWEKIDENLILRHKTSKRNKDIEINLLLAPMVIEEFNRLFGGPIYTVDETTKKVTVHRHLLPTTGPVILCEINAWPYTTEEFRRKWRKVANTAGVPKQVKNMDTRSGALTEAAQAGVSLEAMRKAATHSNISQTQNYSRGDAEAVADYMTQRVGHRNKPKT